MSTNYGTSPQATSLRATSLRATSLPRATSIAVIGMAGRFPGADNLERFWSNIVQGVESITFFSDEELLAAGADRELLARPDFVKASPVLRDIDQFDAAFFKIGKREAELMDPQQRILLEIAWHAMEEAGYAPDGQRGLVGVFTGGGGSMSSYVFSPFHVNRRLLGPTGSIQAVGNDKDYLSTRVSYKLNLRGPSLTVQTACSTSLVAVHLACQSLLAGECDMALAGGVTVRVPHTMGYFHSGHALLSPDGHCRAFDAGAQGTLFGSGAGLVLLKPLPKAVEDGDHIHAVIRGSAINNDGAAKLSYWASSADGQAAAVADALAVAETEPETIGYLEAHGTATTMGDPVEIVGLTKAFRHGTHKTQFCPLGSVKSNIGHLEAAAGVASFIKAVLALEHKTLPPSLHFSTPNPAIHFENTPFYVNTERRPWAHDSPLPRRAGVNSLGIGGTNAHIILEESPETAPAQATADRPLHVLTLSAKSPRALADLVTLYASRLAAPSQANLPDVCFTANAGRSHFKHRLVMIVESLDDARAKLAAWDRDPLPAGMIRADADKPQSVAFIFPGEGSLQVNLGRPLYESQPAFRQAIEQCDAMLRAPLGRSLVAMLYPQTGEDSRLDEPSHAQSALFALEFALAQLWKSWGVEPAVSLGSGVGQFTAACVAGVFSLEDALGLVTARARFAQASPEDRQKATAEFQRACGEVKYHHRHGKVMTPAGQLAAAEFASAEYWRAQLEGPADLSASLRAGAAAFQKLGCGVFLEVGPKSCAADPAVPSLKDAAGLWLAGLRCDEADWPVMLRTLSQLYARGIRIDWEGFDHGFPRRRVSLPTYPFQRQRFWIEDGPDDSSQGCPGAAPASAVVRLLSEGKVKELAAAMDAGKTFSDEELRLLPKVLQALADQHRKESSPSASQPGTSKR